MFPGNMSARDTIPPAFGGNLPPGRPSQSTRGIGPSPLLPSPVDHVPQGVILLSEAGRILHANAAAPGIFGYGAEELVGLDFATLVPDDSVDRLKHFWIDLKPCRMGLDRPLSGRRKDGSLVFLELGLNVVPGAESRLIVACVVDVTQKHDLETSLAVATDESLGFQRLMADVAFLLAAAEPEEVDDRIVTGLHKMAETLNLDGAIVWQAAAGKTGMVPTHHWMPASCPPPRPFTVDDLPGVISRLRAGEACSFISPDEVSDPVDREMLRHFAFQAVALFPMAQRGSKSDVPIAVMFGSTRADRPWQPMTLERLRFASLIIGQAVERSVSEAALQRALAQSSRQGDIAKDEIIEVRRNGAARMSRAGSSESEPVRRAYAQVELVAPTPSTVLLLGETGSGKEVFAQAIHDLSPRHHRPMIRVSCAAIPSALIESELFGRERGAYTGALSKQIGRFEAADRSTLFLDEIGELPAEVQVKLLRVLQERVIERLGGLQTVKVDVRIIAATNRNLEKAVENKTFREDLYLPAQRLSHRGPTPPGAARRHPCTSVGICRRILEIVRQDHRLDSEGHDARAAAL